MNRVLERLCTVSGIHAAAVFHHGVCLANHGEGLDGPGPVADALHNTRVGRIVVGSEVVAFRRRGDLVLAVRARRGLDLDAPEVLFHLQVALRVLGIRAGSSPPPHLSR